MSPKRILAYIGLLVCLALIITITAKRASAAPVRASQPVVAVAPTQVVGEALSAVVASASTTRCARDSRRLHYKTMWFKTFYKDCNSGIIGARWFVPYRLKITEDKRGSSCGILPREVYLKGRWHMSIGRPYPAGHSWEPVFTTTCHDGIRNSTFHYVNPHRQRMYRSSYGVTWTRMNTLFKDKHGLLTGHLG